MDTLVFCAFMDEFTKLSALSASESSAYKDAVRRHAGFEQRSAAKKMTPSDEEAMRHNVDRLKHYGKKKKDDSYKIPGWVHDTKGKPPPPKSARSHSVFRMSLGDKMVIGAGLGGYAGAVGGGILQRHLSKKHKAEGTSGKHPYQPLATGLGAPVLGAALGAGAGYLHHRYR